MLSKVHSPRRNLYGPIMLLYMISSVLSIDILRYRLIFGGNGCIIEVEFY